MSSELRHLLAARAGRMLVGAVAALAVLTVAGLVALWPGSTDLPGPDVTTPTVAARVVATREAPCPGPTSQRCVSATIEVGGRRTQLNSLGPVATAPRLSAGDRLRVTRVDLPEGTPASVREQTDPYAYVDRDRHGPLLVLVAVLGLAAVLVLRGRGLLAVLGVGLSILLVALFVVPAILDGRSALLVALVGSLAVMFVTLILTNGIGAQTMAAALGIAATLAFAALLAVLATHLVVLDGRTDETSALLAQRDGLSLRGVVLAGMLIGALGVLADTAVTQASAVMALRRANPALDAAGLYRAAFVVGRDHLSATIHTLVLAYVGGTLPLLLALRSVDVGLTDGLNYQDIAGPIAAAAVGCLALVAAVPLTTLLASRVVAQLPTDAVPAHAHAH